MKFVMYHYVREFNSKYPFFRFLEFDDFRRQLDYFEKEVGFVSQQDFISVIKNQRITNNLESKVVLTFDDAMSCHYQYVFPELLSRNLWGIFYVPTMPYLNGEMLTVHKVHELTGVIDGSELYERAVLLISDGMISPEKRLQFTAKTYLKQNNRPGVTEFKRLMNYFIEPQLRASFINQLADHLGYQFSGKDFYVPECGLQEMASKGMLIGSHSVTHPVMSQLSYKDQQIEINNSFSWLERTISQSPLVTYCHPYGGFHSFNENTISILKDNGVDFSLSVESRDLKPFDLTSSLHHLPRYDCNEFPHGKVNRLA